eukprot:826101_1
MNLLLPFLAICSLYCTLVCGYIGIDDNTFDGTAAEAYCLSNFNSHLASIHSQSDQDELLSLCDTLNSGLYCRIGLNWRETDGTWVWNDGTCVTNTNWRSTVPFSTGSTEYSCAYVYKSMNGPSSAGFWFAARCSGVNANYAIQPFICNDPLSGTSVCDDSPTTEPSSSPTSSCLDYNNETSADGNNEIRTFDEKHITNIDNYFMNDAFLSTFYSYHDNDQQLIECVGSDCVIHCMDCVGTDIVINIQNKITLLLCHDDYSCPGASVKTRSGSMANISVVCIGQYSC